MVLDTRNLARCIATLELSLESLRGAAAESIQYEVFRNAVVKGFELTLETTGKLLRKALKEYGGAPREVDALTFKDLLRTAVKHGLLSADEVTRWIAYRDNRNSTAHDYGVGFAEETLGLMPGFLKDARSLEDGLRKKLGRADA